jgi:proliferating cell nuclear antigen
MKIFELKTIQCIIFRILVEALKEIVTDVNFEISSEGIKVVQIDISQTVLVHLKLKAENFEYFKCDYSPENPLTVGVNMFNLFKIIKTISNDDTLTLYIDDEQSGVIAINFNNSVKNSHIEYKLNLIEINEEKYTIPPITFDSVVNKNSGDFQKIIKDMDGLSDRIEIQTVGKQLMFATNDDIIDVKMVFAEDNDDSTKNSNKIFFDINTDEIIQGYFSSKHLHSFTKCTNLSNNVKLYLKNDHPMVVEYMVGNLGQIKLLIGPLVDN